MSLQDKIEQYIETVEADFGIHIKHLETNEEVHIESSRLFQMASVVKVPILATLYKLVEEGKVQLDERITIQEKDSVGGSGVFKEMNFGIEPTVKDLATMMIIVSDNLATDAILKITSVESIEAFMRELGLKDIYVKHTIWELFCLCVGFTPEPYSKEFFAKVQDRLTNTELDKDSIVYTDNTENNVGSAKAMSQLIEQIVLGEVVSKERSKEIHDIMLKQQYKQRIGGKLPKEAVVASKTGSLGTIVNDSGVVYLPENNGTYIITVFSDGKTLDYNGNEVIANISQIACDHFMKQ